MHSKSLLGNYRPCCLRTTVVLGFHPPILVGLNGPTHGSEYHLDRSNGERKEKKHSKPVHRREGDDQSNSSIRFVSTRQALNWG